MVVELEIKKLREEMNARFSDLFKVLSGKAITGNWVKQREACNMLGIKERRLRDIRIHQDKNKRLVGTIRWRKGRGKTVEYHKADIESYRNAITVG